MKLSIRLALLFAGIYMLLELVLLFTGVSLNHNSIVWSMGGNTLCLLLAVALSILIHFNRNKHGGLSMIVDIKTGLTTSAIYALVIALFLTFYYTVLNPDYPETRKRQMVELMQTKESEKALEKEMQDHPEKYIGMSLEDVQEMNIDNAEHILSTKTVFPITLFVLLLLGMIYSFFVMGLNRLVLSKL